MTIDTNELRRLAQAATPGPWYATKSVETNSWAVWSDTTRLMELRPTKTVDMYQVSNTAAFVAAANPAAISELLDRIEAAEKERDNANAAAIGIALKAEKLEEERDDLRTKIEAMEEERDDLRESKKWYRRRCDLLQEQQSKMRDPERTMVCDILANGALLHADFAGDRYATPSAQGEEK